MIFNTFFKKKHVLGTMNTKGRVGPSLSSAAGYKCDGDLDNGTRKALQKDAIHVEYISKSHIRGLYLKQRFYILTMKP